MTGDMLEQQLALVLSERAEALDLHIEESDGGLVAREPGLTHVGATSPGETRTCAREGCARAFTPVPRYRSGQRYCTVFCRQKEADARKRVAKKARAAIASAGLTDDGGAAYHDRRCPSRPVAELKVAVPARDDAHSKACIGCGQPMGLERRRSGYCSDSCRADTRERRQCESVAARAAAWSFGCHLRLFQVLDHRAVVRLRPPDFELVKQHRATALDR